MSVPTDLLVDLTNETVEWSRWLEGHPELTQVEPPTVPGFGTLMSYTIAILGVAITDKPLDGEDLLRDDLRILQDMLNDDTTPKAALDRQIARVHNGAQYLLEVEGGVQFGAALGLEAMPSPNAINTATGAKLSNAVAQIAVWQRAHHREVHGNLLEAQGRANAAAAALGSSTAAATNATVDAIRAIVQQMLPDAIDELTALVHEERQDRRDEDQDTRKRLSTQIDRVDARIDDMLDWLKHDALPDLQRQVDAEVEARKQAIVGVSEDLDAEAATRADADTALQTQLAPLAAWYAGFGLHTTEKVNRNESIIDELEHLDWSNLLAFAGLPALTALVAQLMPAVLEASPAAIGGLEGAAAELLGTM
jgi:hypothetical protein